MILPGSELVCGFSQSVSDEGPLVSLWVSWRGIQVLPLLKLGTNSTRIVRSDTPVVVIHTVTLWECIGGRDLAIKAKEAEHKE